MYSTVRDAAPAVGLAEPDDAGVGVHSHEIPLEVALDDARFDVGDRHVPVRAPVRRVIGKIPHRGCHSIAMDVAISVTASETVAKGRH